MVVTPLPDMRANRRYWHDYRFRWQIGQALVQKIGKRPIGGTGVCKFKIADESLQLVTTVRNAPSAFVGDVAGLTYSARHGEALATIHTGAKWLKNDVIFTIIT